MNFVAYFAVIIPLQFLLIVAVLYLIRRRTLGTAAGSIYELAGMVLILTIAVNVVAFIPVIGVGAVIVWIIGLKRLSNLDVLSTVILAFSLGIVCLVLAIAVGRYMQVPFIGQQTGG